jgi:hypothetical protein
METWLSGRKHLTANEAGSKSPPGFESLRLRQVELARDPSEMTGLVLTVDALKKLL